MGNFGVYLDIANCDIKIANSFINTTCDKPSLRMDVWVKPGDGHPRALEVIISGMATGVNPNAWNNWYHGVGSTYGTWIRGDPRGFRTFHHRFHVEGDYRKPPPPGVYAPIFEACKKAMRYPPVKLDMRQRRIICRAMIDKIMRLKAEPVALAIMYNHFHLLGRYPLLNAAEQKRLKDCILDDGRDPSPRHFLGLARKHASFELSMSECKPESPVWAVRPKFDPIRDRGHQVNVAHYIEDHQIAGAAVWVCWKGFLF